LSDTESARTPFEPGAPAAAGAIPLAVPHLAGNEWAYVKEALDTNWVSSAGPFVDRFERMVAGVVDTPYAVAVASGSAPKELRTRERSRLAFPTYKTTPDASLNMYTPGDSGRCGSLSAICSASSFGTM